MLKYGQKYFVTTTKCLVLLTKRLVAAANFLVAATKKIFVVPNFVAVTKLFFFVQTWVHSKQTRLLGGSIPVLDKVKLERSVILFSKIRLSITILIRSRVFAHLC